MRHRWIAVLPATLLLGACGHEEAKLSKTSAPPTGWTAWLDRDGPGGPVIGRTTDIVKRGLFRAA